MIASLSPYISLVFELTTLLSIYLFYKAANNSGAFLLIMFLWLGLQTVLSLNGFYLVSNTLPPRFALLPGPAIVFIIFLFITKKGRAFIDKLDLKLLTLLHVVRIPVELALLGLFMNGLVPQLMTFEGRNWDILSGITAPIVAIMAFRNGKTNRKLLLAWNFVCLGLLANIVVNAALSAPTPFQQFAFEQPNVAILYFPFVWLPCCVVPLVLLSHLASIRLLMKR